MQNLYSTSPTKSEIFIKLLSAYHKCKNRKVSSVEIFRFESRLGENLNRLSHRLYDGTYSPKPLRCFAVDHPKPREIFAASFEDRLVHHLIVDPLEKIWEPKFTSATFACRKGLGPLKALQSIEQSVRSISEGARIKVWSLHLDIKLFYRMMGELAAE
jgi:hypothetical protein